MDLRGPEVAHDSALPPVISCCGLVDVISVRVFADRGCIKTARSLGAVFARDCILAQL